MTQTDARNGLAIRTNAPMAQRPTPMAIAMESYNNPQVLAVIKDQICPGATPAEMWQFLARCVSLGLDPFSKQIYFIKRQGKVSHQIGIDGFRSIADNTGELVEIGEAEFQGEIQIEGGLIVPELARVTVVREIRGRDRAFTGTARWREFCPASPNDFMWKKMPFHMLGKCFSEDTEVLTDRGFQRFSDVSGRVLQVTDRGLEATDARPFVQEWSGPMVTLESDDLNFSVTPNHDMVTTEGKLEAGAMYARAKTRPRFWIPRSVSGTQDEAAIDDKTLCRAAAYLADGQDTPNGRFRIEVSRLAKVAELREIGGFEYEREQQTAGDAVLAGGVRTITTRFNKIRFVYGKVADLYLCEPGKQVRTDRLMSLSRRQARVFVDALVAFDGSTNRRSGVRRFYSSRLDHIQAFEVAANVAGYAVSPRRERFSDIATKPNYQITISGRSEIPVVRWGAPWSNSKANAARRMGLEMTTNASGRVWCVTVPSGVIVVRRNGFSMLCGNCAEAQAMRRAFPQKMGGLQTDAEAMGAEEIFAASAQMRATAPQEPIFVEVVDQQTGEISNVRAGDEYARMMQEQGEDISPIVASPVQPDTVEVLKRDLDAIISDSEPVSAAPPSASDPAPSGEDELDYAQCYELWEAYPNVTYPKPMRAMKPAQLREWRDGLLAKAKEAAMT